MVLNNVKDDKIWLIVLRMFECNSLEFLILMNDDNVCLLDASECHWRLSRIDETLIPLC